MHQTQSSQPPLGYATADAYTAVPALQVSSLAKQIVSLWKDKVSSTSASQLAPKAGSSLLPKKPKAAAAVAAPSAAAAAAAAERIRGNAKQLMLKALQQHCDAVGKVSGAGSSAGAEAGCSVWCLVLQAAVMGASCSRGACGMPLHGAVMQCTAA